MTTSLDAQEYRAALNAPAPRVSIDDIRNNIVSIHYLNAGTAIVLCGEDDHAPPSAELLTLCIMVCKNGFTVVGKSACASPENFDPAKGREIAYDDAIEQLWPLMGYALRERLANG